MIKLRHEEDIMNYAYGTALPFTISFTLNFLFIDWLLLRKKLGWKYVCANEIIVIALLVLLL